MYCDCRLIFFGGGGGVQKLDSLGIYFCTYFDCYWNYNTYKVTYTLNKLLNRFAVRKLNCTNPNSAFDLFDVTNKGIF